MNVRRMGWVAALVISGTMVRAELEVEIGDPEAGLNGGQVTVLPPPGIHVMPPVGSPSTNATPTPSAPVVPDQLIFFNGDQLRGTLTGITSEAGVRWAHPGVKTPIDFAPALVQRIKLSERASTTAGAPKMSVRLTNDDELGGELVELNAQSLVLKTVFAGELTIPRAMLKGLTPNAAGGSVLYEGPTGMEDWKCPQGNQCWTYKDGAFMAMGQGGGAIGREIKFKDRTRIEFDLAWINHPYLQIGFFGDNLENMYGNGNCYMMQLSGNSVYLHRGRGGNFNNLGENANLSNIRPRGRAHFAILIDKTRRTVALLADGALVKQWTDPNEFAGNGSVLMFQSQGQGPMRLSGIVVGEWDGELPRGDAPSAGKDDLLRLTNQDKMSGEVKTITKGVVSFATAFATLEVPLDRIDSISFAADRSTTARREKADVQAIFRNGGRVTLALEKLDEKSLVGKSENFGQQTFDRAAFRELRLNLYDEKASAKANDVGLGLGFESEGPGEAVE